MVLLQNYQKAIEFISVLWVNHKKVKQSLSAAKACNGIQLPTTSRGFLYVRRAITDTYQYYYILVLYTLNMLHAFNDDRPYFPGTPSILRLFGASNSWCRCLDFSVLNKCAAISLAPNQIWRKETLETRHAQLLGPTFVYQKDNTQSQNISRGYNSVFV